MNKHRHHYIPQGFLKGFNAPDDSSDKLIWLYNKDKYSKPRKISTKSIGYETDYYAQEIDDDFYDYNKLENAFSEVENTVIPIISSLHNSHGSVNLSEINKGYLSYFVALLLTRVPSFREGIENIHSKAAKLCLDRVMSKAYTRNKNVCFLIISD
jgi:hypothetical protein